MPPEIPYSQPNLPPVPPPTNPLGLWRKWLLIIFIGLVLLAAIGYGFSLIFNKADPAKPTPSGTPAPSITTEERSRVSDTALTSSQLDVTVISAESGDIDQLVVKALEITSDLKLNGNLIATGNGSFGGNLSAANLSGNGSGVTNVNASALGGRPASFYLQLANLQGSLTDAQLSSNVALRNANNTFSRNNTFNGTTTIQNLVLGSPVAIGSGGTGAATAAGALSNLGGAARGANGDITSLSGLTTALSISQGGTGATSLITNGIVIGQGTSALTTVTTGTAGHCLVSTAGAPAFQVCPGGGGGGVTSLDGLTGGVSIANTSGAGATITINDATIASKGIASFNAGNFSITSGAVNTIQDIATGSSPTFAGVNTNTITPSSTLTIGAAAQTLTLQGNGSTSLSATSGGITNTLQFATPATSGKTITIPNATGVLAVSASGPLGIDGNGNLTCATCVTSGGGGGGIGAVDSLNGLTGALSIANSSGLGTTITINDATTGAKGIASFNATNFTSSSGAVNTVQNINTTADPTFRNLALSTLSVSSSQATSPMVFANNTNGAGTGNLIDLQLSGVSRFSVTPAGNMTVSGSVNGQTISNTASFTGSLAVTGAANLNGGASVTGTLATNTITPTGAATVGATGQSLTLQGNGSTSLRATTGGITNTLQFAAPATSNKSITIPNASGTVAVSATGPLAIDAAGNLTCATCVTSGGGGGGVGAVDSLDGLTGVLTIANSSGLGSTITINDATTGAKGIASFNSTNFSVTSGAVNTVQNIGTTATPTFTGVNTNAITPSAAFTAGATGQSFTLQGNASSTLTATNGASTTTVSFQAPTANINYRFPTATAGTYDVCTTAGNCIGGGGGVTSPGGTPGALARFTGAQTVDDSIITDNGSTVSIAGDLSVNTITPTAALAIGDTSQSLTLQGNGSTTLTATAGGFTNTLQFATPAASNKTITIPNASGTVAVSASGPLAIDAAGNITCASCVTGGGGGGGIGAVDSLNGLTGTLSVANATGLGSTITINDATTGAKGIASFNSTNFTATSGAVNTIQNINTTASPTFTALNTNTITPSSSLTVGAATQSFTLQGNASSSLTSTSGGNTTTVNFQSPTASVAYRFATAAAGSYDICTSVGNCSGSGANAALSNLSSVAINTSLLTGAATIDLGSNAAPFRDLYLGGTATNNFRFTGTASTARTLTLPNESGTLCTTGSVCTGYAAASGASGYIQNQSASDQTADFRISGSGRASTSILTPLLDTATGTTLNIGTTTATGIGLQQNTTVAANRNLNLASGTGTYSQAFTGTTTDAFTVTANSLTTGTALKVTSASNSAANTAWSGTSLNVTNSQGTTAVSTGIIAGLDVQFTQNTTIAGNNETAANFAIKQNNSASTDSAVSSIVNIANNDTATGNQITATDGLKINGSGITNGINLSGTFGTNLLTSTNLTIAQSGSMTTAGAASLSTAAGALSLQGAAGVNITAGSGNVVLGANDTTGTQFVLDTKNDAGDPTGVNGGSYYNSSAGKFRCYENSVWVDCINSAAGGITTIGAIDTQTKSVNGAVISGSTLYLQSADGSAPGLVTTGTQTIAGAKTLTGNTTLTGTLLQRSDSATALVLQDSTGTYSNLSFNSATNTLRVYDHTAPRTAYSEVYYDSATSSAVYSASAGSKTRIGNGTGSVNVILSNNSEKFDVVHTGTNAISTDVDFLIQRNLTGTSNALQGAVAKIEDLSTFTSGSSAPDVLSINQNNTGATGNLIVARLGGGSNDKFKVSTAGTVTVAASQSYTGVGSLTLASGAGSALAITGNAASTWSTTSGNLTVQAAGTNTLALDTAGAGTVSLGNSSAATVNVGANAGSINIGATAAAHAIIVGSGTGAGSLSLNAGSGGATLNATSSTITLQTTTAGAINIKPGGTSNIVLGTADTTGTLLILDEKSNAGDPTGVNGGMYYSSNMGKFRCYENAAWRNCVMGIMRTTADRATTSTSYSNVTDLTYTVAANTDYTFTCNLIFRSSIGTNGIGLSVNGPASPTFIDYMTGIQTDANDTGTIDLMNEMHNTSYDNMGPYPSSPHANTNLQANIQGVLSNGANAGTFAIRFASEVAGQTITIRKGSSCTVY